jgi:RNA polymerase-binding transcription factor
MELERARSRSSTERGQVQPLLADLGKARTDDHEAERDATYPAQLLAQQGVDDAVAAGLRDRLAALDRASPAGRRRELRSLDPQRCSHPDERLEADPAAELTVQQAAGLTVQQAARDQAADR